MALDFFTMTAFWCVRGGSMPAPDEWLLPAQRSNLNCSESLQLIAPSWLWPKFPAYVKGFGGFPRAPSWRLCGGKGQRAYCLWRSPQP